MIAPFIEETLLAIHIALKAADLTASQVEEILLVGGATRTPMIRRRLLEVFGREPRGEVDADLCVAMGAAIQGAAIGGAEVSAVLVDVTPYTFGTSALGELDGEFYPYQYVPIIARNTPIPVRKSEVFYTVTDDQPAVDVRIYQGENPDALENIKIGEFRVEGLSKAPAGNPVVLDLALDRDGILQVSAREKNTGLERRITYRPGGASLRRGRATGGEGADRFAVRAGRRRSGGGRRSRARRVPRLKALLEKAGARLDTAGEEDRKEMIDLMEAIRDAQVAGDAAALEKARTQLADLIFYLET